MTLLLDNAKGRLRSTRGGHIRMRQGYRGILPKGGQQARSTKKCIVKFAMKAVRLLISYQ
jgi:hypothetical protein